MADAQKKPGTDEVRDLRRLVAKRTADIEESINRLHQNTERRVLFLAVYVTLLVFLVALAVTAPGARAFVMTGLIALFLLALIIYLWQILLAPHYAKQRAFQQAMSRIGGEEKKGGEGEEVAEDAPDADETKEPE